MENMEYQEKAGFIDNVVDLFIAPSKLAERIRQKPQYLLPIVLMSILTIITALAIKDLTLQEQIRASSSLPKEFQMTEEKFNTSFMIGLVLSPLFLIIGNAFYALLYWGIGKMFGGSSSYKNVFSATLYSSVIATLGGLVQSFAMAYTNNIRFQFSPTLFLDTKGMNPWIINALNLVNPIVIWPMIFMVIALKIIHGYKKGSAIGTVITVTILGYFFSSVLLMFSGTPVM